MKLAAVVAVVAMAATASCGTVRTTFNTYRALQRAGYTGIGVRLDSSNGFDTVIVDASGGPAEQPVERAAQIVWTTFKFRFDQVDVTVGGRRRVFSRADLAELFGPRPPGSDKDLKNDVAKTFAIIGGVVLFGLAVLVVVIVLIVRASRKRRPPPGPWYGGWPPPGPPGPPGQPGQQQWPPQQQPWPPQQQPPPQQQWPPQQQQPWPPQQPPPPPPPPPSPEH